MPATFANWLNNDSLGTVTTITAGTGLSGGTITDSGTINIAEGGVGADQIDSTQVQSRVAGSCALGSYLRGINADGSVLCSDVTLGDSNLPSGALCFLPEIGATPSSCTE